MLGETIGRYRTFDGDIMEEYFSSEAYFNVDS